MTTKIGGIVVDIDARLAKLETSLAKGQRDFKKFEKDTLLSARSIERHVSGISNSFKAMGAAIAATGLVAVGKRALDYASSLGEVSQQLGVTTKDLQVYRYAASQVGIAQEDMDKALGKLSVTIGKASLGGKAQVEVFKALGISVEDANGRVKTAGEIIPELADKLAGVQDPAKRAAIEVELFGRAGQKLDTLLAGGKGQIDGLADAAQRLGLVLSDEQIRKADEAADKFAELKMVLEARIAGVVADNAAAIASLADGLMYLVNAAGKAVTALGNFKTAHNRAVMQRLASDAPAGSPLAKMAQNALAEEQKALRSQGINAARMLNMGSLSPKAPATAASDTDIPKFLASGGGKAKKDKPKEDPIAEMMKAVDISIRNWRDGADSLYDQIGIKEDDLLKTQLENIENRRDVELDARMEVAETMKRIEEMQIQNLARLFEDGFRGGTKAIWSDFKDIGLAVISQVLAKFTIAQVSGQGGGFNLGSAISGAFTSVLGFASGGRPPVGRASMVGERGPELFIPDQAGTVIPNHMLGVNDNVARGGGASVVNQTITFSGAVDLATREEVYRIAEAARLAAMQGVAEGRRRSA